MAAGGNGGALIVPKHWDENHHKNFYDYLYNRGGIEMIRKRMKENNPMKGRKHTKESREKMAQSKEKYKGEYSERSSGKGNPMYGRNDQCYGVRRWNAEVKGKTAEEIYGVERAKERAEKQSDIMKKRWQDENYRQRRHEQSKERGKIISERLKEYNKRNAKTCPYCGKTVSPTNFSRWHGERCKNKNIGEL